MYRFLGGLFDADSSLDHAHVLDKVRRRACRAAISAQTSMSHLPCTLCLSGKCMVVQRLQSRVGTLVAKLLFVFCT